MKTSEKTQREDWTEILRIANQAIGGRTGGRKYYELRIKKLKAQNTQMLEALKLCKRELFNTYLGEKLEGRKGSATKTWEKADAAIRAAKGEGR